MKVVERVRDVTSNFPGEKIIMELDKAATVHLMSMFIDLYSDPELAVLREYSTNAWDSHKEAGVTRPIEVTLPTSLSSFLRIRDFGVGMDVETIRNIYSKYGASTKRGTNDQVGQLGLGCKSALTYQDQFTLTGWKNGRKVQVAISRDRDGRGSMTVLCDEPTTEENGVEVTIPAKYGHEFAFKADRFFRFWDEGSVLVNGKAPERVGGLWISDNILLTKEVDTDYIVMGNVAYPRSDADYRSYHTVCFVEIGDVNFVPSREALRVNDPTTDATLEKLNKRIIKEKQAALERHINAAATPWEAIVVAKEANDMGLGGVAKYKGKEIPAKHSHSWYDEKNHKMVHTGCFISVDGVKQNYRRYKGWRKLDTHNTHEQNVIWFTGYDSDAFTPYKRAKLDQWVAKKGLAIPSNYILTSFIPDAEWVDPSRIFDWESGPKTEKIQRDKVERQDGRPTGSYDGWVAGVSSDKVLAGDIDTTKPLFYCMKNEFAKDSWGRQTNPSGLPIIKGEYPDSTIITLGQNRLEKFKRDFPMARRVNTVAQELAEAWKKSLTEDDLVGFFLDDYDYSYILMVLDENEIDDPELKLAIQMLNSRAHVAQVKKKDMFYHFVTPDKPKMGDPLANYPLLTNISRYGSVPVDVKKHMPVYINAVFTANQGGSV